jgi:3-deoxy-D-manno-octulosonic-acid transferase
MAFTIRDLSVLAYANGFTLWHYKTGNDSPADVAVGDYFGEAGDMMAAGDIVLISGSKGCRLLCITLVDGGNVVSAPVA